MSKLSYEGCAHFRMRLAAATLSGKRLKIEGIRSNELSAPGLQDFEASYLRLIDKLSDGCDIAINETGTVLRYSPGILLGGSVTHDCGLSKSIGWFIEGIIPLAVFCKEPLHITFTGITNDSYDLSVDTIRHITLPMLRNFGIEGASLKVVRRGAAPKGGGAVEFFCPVMKTLKPVHAINSGQIRRVRGVVFCARITPTVITRVVESAKAVLNNVITDVFINSDHYKGKDSCGESAGYSVVLVGESTTGARLSIERTAGQGGSHELPETVGRDAAVMLLDEICKGGVVDSSHQALCLHLMALSPEDVCKIRFGSMTENSIEACRIIRDAYGVIFKIKVDKAVVDKKKKNSSSNKNNSNSSGNNDSMVEEISGQGEGDDDFDEGKVGLFHSTQDTAGVAGTGGASASPFDPSSRKYTDESGTLLVSCLGSGYVNMSRKIR